MASISSSFHCLSSMPCKTRSSSSSPPLTCVRFQKPRPISAVCVAERSTASFYDVLGIQSEASCQEIKAAYRRLARVLHPDVAAPANGQNDVASGSDGGDFIKVHEAYATLSDPGKRADYDRVMFIRRRLVEGSNSVDCRTPRGPSASRFKTHRSWETDQCW